MICTAQAGNREHDELLDATLASLQHHKCLDVNPAEVEDLYRRCAGAVQCFRCRLWRASTPQAPPHCLSTEQLRPARRTPGHLSAPIPSPPCSSHCRLQDRLGEFAQFEKQRALGLLQARLLGLPGLQSSQYDFQHRVLAFLYRCGHR